MATRNMPTSLILTGALQLLQSATHLLWRSLPSCFVEDIFRNDAIPIRKSSKSARVTIGTGTVLFEA